MEPPGIHPGREKGDHRRPLPRLFPGFPDPPPDLPAIGRIHEYRLTRPRPPEAVIFRGEVLRAFGRPVGRAWVQGEPELLIQWVEDFRGRLPVVSCAGHHRFDERHRSVTTPPFG